MTRRSLPTLSDGEFSALLREQPNCARCGRPLSRTVGDVRESRASAAFPHVDRKALARGIRRLLCGRCSRGARIVPEVPDGQ